MTMRHHFLLAIMFVCLPVGNALADGCAGHPHCYDAGPFAAKITGVVTSWDQYHKQQFVRLNLRIENHNADPVILGFRWGSAASLTDNYGNSFTIDTRFARNVVGLGLIRREGADTSFAVAPGSSRDASLIFHRWVGKSAIGNRYSADFSIEQLQPVPGSRQVRQAGQYSLSFADLDGGMRDASPGAGQASAGDVYRVLDHLRHKH